MSRATDAKGDSQPIDGLTRWNPRGYEWNGADRVELRSDRNGGERRRGASPPSLFSGEI